jgi:hypothetical protein
MPLTEQEELELLELEEQESQQVQSTQQPQRKAREFISPTPPKEQTQEMLTQGMTRGGIPLGLTKAVIGRGISNVLTALQREESVATATLQQEQKLPLLMNLLSKVSPVMKTMTMTQPEVIAAARGETAPELGDMFRDMGVPEPMAAGLGLVAAGGLPSSIAGSAALRSLGIGKQVVKTSPTRASRALGQLLGVQQEVLDDIAKMGPRDVIQKRFFNSKLPAILQEKFTSAINKIKTVAQGQFDEATEQLKNTPFEPKKLYDALGDFIENNKTSLFKGAKKDFNDNIVEGLKRLQQGNRLSTLGDLLDVRKTLDDEIDTAYTRRINTDFVKGVRETINNTLHKNDLLKTADNTWTALKTQLDSIGRRIQNDSGETILKRFRGLPEKTKQRIIDLQRFINSQDPKAENIIDDVVKGSLARELLPKKQVATVSSGTLKERLLLPAFRFVLRTGPVVDKLNTAIQRNLSPLAVPVSKTIGSEISKQEE